MKSALRSACFAASLCLLPLGILASEGEPAYLNFNDITPAKAGQFVEVDLDAGILSLAAKFADGQEKEAAELLRGLKSVKVRVVSLDDGNRSDVLERIASVRRSLAEDGWKRLVVARDANGQDVAVFARTQGDEAVQGLAVTVVDGIREAVIVNIVGNVRPEQISALGARFGIDPLKNVAVAAK